MANTSPPYTLDSASKCILMTFNICITVFFLCVKKCTIIWEHSIPICVKVEELLLIETSRKLSKFLFITMISMISIIIVIIRGAVKEVTVFGGVHHKVEDPAPSQPVVVKLPLFVCRFFCLEFPYKEK